MGPVQVQEIIKRSPKLTAADARAAVALSTVSRQEQSVEPAQLLASVQNLQLPEMRLQTVFAQDPASFDLLLEIGMRTSSSPYPLAMAQAVEDLASKPYLSTLFPKLALELDRHLKATLPDYMLPARYQQMAQLPLGPSGKVARLKLPELSRSRPALAQEFVEPKGDTELAIAGVWQEVLELDGIGSRDNFFDLGGNSILSVRAVLRMNEQLQRADSVVVLFQHPTIAEFAQRVDAAISSTGNTQLSEGAVQRAGQQRQALRNRQRRLRKAVK